MSYNHKKTHYLKIFKNEVLIHTTDMGKIFNDFVVNQKNSHVVDSTCTKCPEKKNLHNVRKEFSGQRGL